MRLGIDFGGTNIKAGIFSEEGKTLFFSEQKLLKFTANGNLLINLINHAKEISEGFNLSQGGLAIKGLINSETGILEDDIGAGSLLSGINLKKNLKMRYTFPLKLKMMHVHMLGENINLGRAMESSAMVCMTLGNGLRLFFSCRWKTL